jgi:hypothetical protein
VNAYTPGGAGIVVALAVLLGATLAAGRVVTRLPSPRAARALAWGLVVASVAGALGLTAREPAGVRMLAIVATLLYALKAIVTVEWQIGSGRRLDGARWLAFAAAWPGMNPRPFERTARRPQAPVRPLMARGAAALLGGVALLGAARALFPAGRGLASAAALAGLSLILHFGVFLLLTAFWRRRDVDAGLLFDAPLRSRSLAEFWSRRWNVAYSEMTAIAVYRPLAPRVGRSAALLGAFALSGLFHELAISAPVRSGFGPPFAYFLAHGALVVLERGSALGPWLARHPRLARVWTAAWVIGPLPWLFHPPFLAGVVWPLLTP